MSRMLFALFLLVLVLGIASAAISGPNDKWIIYLRASDSSYNSTSYLAAACMFGTTSGATDSPAESGNDSSNAAKPSGNNYTAAALACFDLGTGTNGNGYYKDLRAPISSGVCKTWNLRLWVQSDWSGGDVYLTGWNQAGTYALNGSIPVRLYVANDPTGTYDPDHLIYTFDGHAQGTSSNPNFSGIVFHNTDVIKGSGGTYVSLVLTTEPIPASSPEPCSLTTLLGALGGFSGFLALRKRRA